ncbi:MAG: hypothetical protein U0136_19940 [Bdellovibrionota bacterium]
MSLEHVSAFGTEATLRVTRVNGSRVRVINPVNQRQSSVPVTEFAPDALTPAPNRAPVTERTFRHCPKTKKLVVQ